VNIGTATVANMTADESLNTLPNTGTNMSMLKYIDHQVFPGIIQHWLRHVNFESGAYTYKYSMNMANRDLPILNYLLYGGTGHGVCYIRARSDETK